MTIMHIDLPVTDCRISRDFYEDVLAPLGLSCLGDCDGWVGFGQPGHPELRIGMQGGVRQLIHIAFRADNREQVRAFHRAALAVGAEARSAPQLYVERHADCYAAQVYDPDGHRIEVVCERRE